jgi:two-component system response regulator DctR
VIFLTGHADLPTAVDAVKRGAFDFCEKPVSDNALVDRVEQAWPIGRAARAAPAYEEVRAGWPN